MRERNLQRVAIVSDTTACLLPEHVKEYGIAVVPLALIFEDKVYQDGIDISPADFYELLRQAKKLPTTSGSSPDPYLEAYEKASKKAESIVCITEPSGFSAMFNSAKLAMDMARTTLAGVAIEVIECATAAAGLGLVTLAAARASASGKALKEVINITKSVMSQVSLFAMLDTLHYLVKGGRVPQAAALVNSVLQIKPVFTLNRGEAHTVALSRTVEGAMKHILRMMEQKAVRGQPLHVVVMHANATDRALELRNRISAHFDCSELFITEFTPVMGVHTGPGLVGVAFYSDQPPLALTTNPKDKN
jgi:DegV family protein with EDD domain